MGSTLQPRGSHSEVISGSSVSIDMGEDPSSHVQLAQGQSMISAPTSFGETAPSSLMKPLLSIHQARGA